MSDCKTLGADINKMGITLSNATLERLLAFVCLLQKWNRTYNLSAITDHEQIITHHILDSLSLLPFLPQHTVTLADVGSGAGLPGIVLAIAAPHCHVTSIDTVGKKISFQQQAKIELQLDNFYALKERVENVTSVPAVEYVVSRAFASLADFVVASRHLLAGGGQFIAMKGRLPDDEIAGLPEDIHLCKTIAVDVPRLRAERHLIFMEIQ